MSEWREYKLGEIAEVQTGPFGSQLHQSDYQSTGTPIITVEHLGDNKIIHANLPLVGDKDKHRLSKFLLQKGDIVFSRVGSVDRSAYVSDGENGWLFSGRCLRVRVTNDKVNSRFLSYYFGQENFKEQVRRVAVGATMPSINTSILSNMGLCLPGYQTQSSIASILGSLDDKIDLLHRQNKTLEQLAETLFRQWFIEEASNYWYQGKLGDVITLYDNKRIPLSSLERDNMRIGKLYPYYGAATILDYINSYIFDGEYILMAEDGSVETKEGNPVLQLAVGKFWVNNHAHIFTANLPYTNFFLYIFLRNINVSSIITGAVQPKINQQLLRSIEFLIPPRAKTTKFVEMSNQYWEKIKLNNSQIQNLVAIRNKLLSKIMSHETHIRNYLYLRYWNE